MIDSHCHINDELYKNNPKEYIKEAENAGVFQFLVVGFDKKSSELALKIANENKSCFAAVGIHPSDVKKAADVKKEIVESRSAVQKLGDWVKKTVNCCIE